MKKRGEPGYLLEQLLGTTFHQDWSYADYNDPFEAVEDWFRATGEWESNNHALIADIDDLFSATSSPEERFAHFTDVNIRRSDLDPLLKAIRNRAVTGLAGKPEPIRAPE